MRMRGQVQTHRRPWNLSSTTATISIRPITATGPIYFLICTVWFVGGRSLSECVEAFGEGALATGEHGRVAQGETTRFGFAEFLEQVEKIGRLVGFEGHDKFLIVQAEGISRVQ